MSHKPPVIVIAGPTGVGKTSLALTLGERFAAEIVNADSRSFYRGMDIGTAKPTPSERERVHHHLVDIIDPSDEMSLSLYQQLAFTAIDDIGERGKLPFLVGGTAQYLNATIEHWKIPQVAPDADFRTAMEERVAAEGFAEILEELRRVDPESANRAGSNPRRMIRALEVFRATGIPMSQLQGRHEPKYEALEFELWLPRETLHRRIEMRVAEYLERGLIVEVRELLDRGFDSSLPAFSSIGYREVLPYLRGEASLEQTAEAIVHASNRLVRHQQTWLRKNRRLIRIDMTTADPAGTIQARVEMHLVRQMRC